MRKIYAFLAAALISVCAFASKTDVPSDAVLGYEPGKVGVCIYIPGDMACFDVVFVGTYNNWGKGEGSKEDARNCVKFEPVDGYDGWYYVAVEDATESPEGKPVMLDVDGVFNWSYQIGTATKIRGGVSIVAGGVAGEIDLKTYGKDAVNVYTVDSWKSNPCTAVYHNYKFTIISDGCDGYVCPFIVGSFTNWSFEQMQYDYEATLANNAPTYYFFAKAAENSQYQFVSGMWADDGSGTISVQPGWNDDSYLQKYVDGAWVRMPSEEEGGDNLLTHENSEITFDIRAEDLRWARCDGEAAESVLVKLIAPAGAPESVEIIGSYDGWTGAPMTLNGNVWEATVSAKASAKFKFRQAGTWDNQISFYDEVEDDWFTFGDEGAKSLIFSELWSGEEGARVVELDFSDPEIYKWTKDASETPSAVAIFMKAPAGAPEAVEVIGSFDGWNGTEMMFQEGLWVAVIDATGDDTFKFRTGIGEDSDAKWQNQIQVLKDGNWDNMENQVFKEHWAQGEGDFADYKIVELDFSDPAAYKWTLSEEQGIESVVLTEKANKVVVNGVIYIVRDNKMFTLQGAQVR